MPNPQCMSIMDAYEKIDYKVSAGSISKAVAASLTGGIGKAVAASVTGEIIRISAFLDKPIPTVKVVTERVKGRRFFFFKKVELAETLFAHESNGWKQQGTEQIFINLCPANEMMGVLYDRKFSLANKIK